MVTVTIEMVLRASAARDAEYTRRWRSQEWQQRRRQRQRQQKQKQQQQQQQQQQQPDDATDTRAYPVRQSSSVIPAKAGSAFQQTNGWSSIWLLAQSSQWIPAFAGMTALEVAGSLG